MANRRKQPRFYDAARMNELKGVALPPKIKCCRCNKFKDTLNNYSNNKLSDARFAIKNGGPNARYNIVCGACTKGQIVELECSMCHKTKGLEKFAKSQQKKGDEATCYVCVDDILSQDAVRDEIYESEDRSKAFDANDSTCAEGYWPTVWEDSTVTDPSETANEWQDNAQNDDGDVGVSLARDLHRKLSMAGQNVLIESEGDMSSEGNRAFWTQAQHAKSWHTNSANLPSTSSGFDPTKYGKPSTSASASGSSNTFNSGFVERSHTSTIRNGWAKIKAHDPKKDGNAPPVDHAQDDWSSESENGDDDDESDDDIEI